MSTTVETTTEIRPFHVDIPGERLDDLRRRIEATRWPSKELVEDRSQGVQLATLQELARYWTTEYDWRKAEARLNALPQFTTEIDGMEIHFIHVRSPHEEALPLIMTHGWPGSVMELLETVGPLTDPTAHGGAAEDAFHLVLPSLPGYGFSGEPAELGWDAGRTARAWARHSRSPTIPKGTHSSIIEQKFDGMLMDSILNFWLQVRVVRGTRAGPRTTHQSAGTRRTADRKAGIRQGARGPRPLKM